MSDYSTTDSQSKLAILEELHRAFDSGLEGVSDRQRALLSYLVTEELEGRGERLKAYSIATEVLGRPHDFDPQQDSIVRVEVARLRQALERYYLTEGKTAPIVISIPKGQYRPVFAAPALPPAEAVIAAPAPEKKRYWLIGALTLLLLGLTGLAGWKFLAAPSPPATAARRGPVVAILPFDFHADRDGAAYVAGGLQADLADILSEYQWLTVIPLSDESALSGGGDPIAKPDFIVRGSLRLIGDQAKATVLLLDGQTREARWTKSYDFHLRAGEVMAMQRDLVTAIGRDVGNPFGIVADIALAQSSGETPSDDAFVCKLRALHYWKTFKSVDYAPARRCFDEAAAKRPLDANSLAMDALLTLDPLSLRFSGRTLPEARAEAAAMASRAFDMNGVEFFPRVARYVTAICVGDLETFRDVARETIERFPNNPVALADVGSRLILSSGDASEGIALIERARAIAPDLTPVDTIAVAIDALRRGVYDNRPRLKRASAQTDAATVHIVELSLAAARGDAEETARVRKRLADLGFADQKQIGEALDATCWFQNVRDLVKSKVTLAFRDARAQ